MLLIDAIKIKTLTFSISLNNPLDVKMNYFHEPPGWNFTSFVSPSTVYFGREWARILSRHNKKLWTLIDLKKTADAIDENPNDTVVNLSSLNLSIVGQLEVLKLRLRPGIATKLLPKTSGIRSLVLVSFVMDASRKIRLWTLYTQRYPQNTVLWIWILNATRVVSLRIPVKYGNLYGEWLSRSYEDRLSWYFMFLGITDL